MLNAATKITSLDSAMERSPRLACREIRLDDAETIVDILTAGFSARSHAYWEHAIAVMGARSVPAGCPRYGYVLTADKTIVGVILLICSASIDGGAPRCYMSSWYVDPAFRAYASWLIITALKLKHAVYVNMSSVAHTRDTIVAQGFSCYAHGTIIAFPALMPTTRDMTVHEVTPDDEAMGPAYGLLCDHAQYGCMSLVCTIEGQRHPFIFLRRDLPKIGLPCAQLIYCDDIEDLGRFVGAIGRYLLKRGLLVVMIDANGPLAGVPGVYLHDRAPKFFRGQTRPRLGDLTYSEAVFFGP